MSGSGKGRPSGPDKQSLITPPARGIFCNRTLNLRSIKAIGYDMDYTLIHYKVEDWERRAYEYIRQKMADQGWPVDDLSFDPARAIRGLIIDTDLGNLLKANRFGYVKRAAHGTRRLNYDEQRQFYSRTIVTLGTGRFEFLNTLFSLSEACLYTQLVDLADQRELPVVMGYRDLYRHVRATLDETHMEGLLKSEIIERPERFVERDPQIVLTLMDQRHAGNKLLLITNSEWHYTDAMMSYAFNQFVPSGTWKDLFDLIIVSARKPAFFSTNSPTFEVVNSDGLLRPCIKGPQKNGAYLGGDAQTVEEYLGLSGDQILYVGDHIYSDVNVSKSVLRWRTALVLRELENEIVATGNFQPQEDALARLMKSKEQYELAISKTRLRQQRKRAGYGEVPKVSQRALRQELNRLQHEMADLDEEISKLAVAAGEVGNTHWGPLMRAGNDKSHLARQVERYADIYLSRVSNFLDYTPFHYFRAPRGSLPHDQEERSRFAAAPDESPI
jgi:HAD superfamily 5'-nucleotidase-like hydrolase